MEEKSVEAVEVVEEFKNVPQGQSSEACCEQIVNVRDREGRAEELWARVMKDGFQEQIVQGFKMVSPERPPERRVDQIVDVGH